MEGHFELEGLNRPVLVLEPESHEEALLMAAFMRYDANAFSMSIERRENNVIAKVTIRASDPG